MVASAPAQVPLLGELLPTRVAVFRALRLGDMLCSIPAVRALRAALPDAEITLIGLPWAEDLPRRYPAYFDSFLNFPGYPGFPEQPFAPADLVAFLDEARRRRFDLIIQMHGDGSLANELVQTLGAAATAGFFPDWEPCPDPRAFLRYPADEPEPRRYLMLVDFLGAPARGEHLEFPLYAADEAEGRALLEEAGIADDLYVCLHVGANSGARWPVERFARVAENIAGRGLPSVLTGVSEERQLADSIAGSVPGAINLCGRTTLGALGALLSGARLLVSNDTGVSHLASALGVPSVVINIGFEAQRWAPLDRERHRTLPGPGPGSSGGDVSPGQVLEEATQLLDRYVPMRTPAGLR